MATIIRGEFCIGIASFFSFISVILLLFTHLAQINTSTIPRGISMIKMNVSGYGVALERALSDPASGVYTNNSRLPLGEGLGLRQSYAWGFYSHCAYVVPNQGICSNTTLSGDFKPFDAIVEDVPLRFQTVTRFIITPSAFTNSPLLSSLSKAGLFLALIGTILPALALLIGLKRGNLTFFLSSALSIIAALMVLTSAAIWTSVALKARSINGHSVNTTLTTGSQTTPLGITVTFGPGMWLLWAAFVTLFLANIPYMINCCTYTG